MILDDGGDLTNMVHEKYPEFLEGIKVQNGKKCSFYFQYLGPFRGDNHWSSQSLQNDEGRNAQVAGNQCQRFCNEI